MMSDFIAALPMYDWLECRAETDAQWRRLRDTLRENGVPAPEALTRGDDLQALWRDPRLLLAQTCWGPMEAGLQEHARLVGQPDYSAYEGGEGAFYSSVILMRAGAGDAVPAPLDGAASIPLERLRNKSLAYNEPVSMSGILALTRHLKAMGSDLSLFSERVQTGGHRASIIAVAERKADVCAIDCRSWSLAQRFEPAAGEVQSVGWTGQRLGLPYITSRATDARLVETLRRVLANPASAHLQDQRAAAR